MKLFFRLFTLLYLVVLSAENFALASDQATVTSKPCPYSCAMIGLGSLDCRDWRVGNTCYVEDLRSGRAQRRSAYRFCVKEKTGAIRIRLQCRSADGERAIALEDFRGDTGETGPQGATGPQGIQGAQGETGPTGLQGVVGPEGPQGVSGPQGERGEVGPTGPQGATGDAGADGTIRIYGDGSAGEKVVSSSTVFNDSNPQYTNFTVESGVTLTVPSGVVIHCTGTFTNAGTIRVLPALRDHPRFAGNGITSNSPSSGGQEAAGGAGGEGLQAGVAKGFLRLGIVGGGNGYREQGEDGGAGGGNFTVISQGAIHNSGTIEANGTDTSIKARGGGGGGFIVLASIESVTNIGAIQANGGDGGELLPTGTDSTGRGPGGGGGGGIVHMIAPLVQSGGSISVNGGTGGASGGAGSITGLVYVGGGGGGGSGGVGGDGGTVNPGGAGGNSTTAGATGASGLNIQTLADPTALF